MCTLTQAHFSRLANLSQPECCVCQVKVLEAGNLSWRSATMYAEHNSAVSLGAERFKAEQLKLPRGKQLRAGLDISRCARLCWVRTERRWFTLAPLKPKLLSASELGSVRQLRGECAPPDRVTLPFSSVLFSSLLGRARVCTEAQDARKQSAKRVCINNVAVWVLQGHQLV